MSIGLSGRVVVEIDPQLKRHLYSRLTREGQTLKDWFVRCADAYIQEHSDAAQMIQDASPAPSLDSENI
jgi:hypothetical protein